MSNAKQAKRVTPVSIDGLDGLPTRIGTCTDVEEQKRAKQQQLKASRENWHVLAETVPQLVWTTSPDGLHEYTNQRWCDYIGFTLEQLQSDRWVHLQFLHPEDREGAQALWLHALETGELYEDEQRIRNSQTGTYRWFLIRALPVCDEAGQITKWFGTCTDIEEQKRTEEALRQSQERANVLMNSNLIGVNIIEGEQIVDANDTFLRMTGYTREDLHEGRMNVRRMTPPEYLARSQQAHQELVTQELMTPYEKEYICKDSSRLPVVVGRVVLQHHPLQGIGFALDNSVRKESEHLRRQLLSNIAHELRTPLTNIRGYLEAIQDQLITPDPAAIASIYEEAMLLSRLVTDLQDLALAEAGQLRLRRAHIALEDVITQAINALSFQAENKKISLSANIASDLPLVEADAQRIGQIMRNLLSNAIKYTSAQGEVRVSAQAMQKEVQVSVWDNGIGIAAEHLPHIFQHFYRADTSHTRETGGSGLGLAIVEQLVYAHGGRISVESYVGQGTCFIFTLPRAREGLSSGTW